MKTSRALFLFAVCVILAGLVWLDNRAQKTPTVSSQTNTGSKLSPKENVIRATKQGVPLSANPKAAEKAAPVKISESGNPLSATKKEAFKATVERPLFAPSRRRPKPAKVARPVIVSKPRPKPKPPLFSLLGIIRDDDRSFALLRSKSNGLNFRVEAGDVIGGWHIVKIETRSVLLKWKDGRSMELSIFKE